MLLEAKKDFNIDFTKSWFIGDSTVDIMTAKNANINSIQLKTGKNGTDNKYDVRADYIKKDLLSAIRFILELN